VISEESGDRNQGSGVGEQESGQKRVVRSSHTSFLCYGLRTTVYGKKQSKAAGGVRTAKQAPTGPVPPGHRDSARGQGAGQT
jgi:hypothetical protein